MVDNLIKELNKRKVAFLEVSEGPSIGMANDITKVKSPFCAKHKKKFNGTWIANFGYTQTVANDHVQKGYADLVSFGWSYVANPDLVEKFKSGATLYSCGNIQDMSNFAAIVYYGGPVGYTDLSVYAPPE
jgi:N-ethylmaleimide reductase